MIKINIRQNKQRVAPDKFPVNSTTSIKNKNFWELQGIGTRVRLIHEKKTTYFSKILKSDIDMRSEQNS